MPKAPVKKAFQREFGGARREAPEICRTDGLKSPLVFAVDPICKRIKYKEKRCDEIVLCDARGTTGVYCIENKGGAPENLKAETIQAQLQGGANIVCKYLADNERIRFLPVLAATAEVPPFLRLQLIQQDVRLREIIQKIVPIAKNEKLPPL